MVFITFVFWAIGSSQLIFDDAVLVVDNVYFTGQKSDKAPESLSSQCKRMLDSEIALINETKQLHSRIGKNNEEKTKSKKALIELSNKQKQIALEAEAIVKTLKANKVAPAFWEAFEIIRSDSEEARTRILKSDVGQGTQRIQDDIAEALKDMIRSLEMRCAS
jgi:hypothetical protein